MNARMIYVTGQPGSGKSTLMARLTSGFDSVDESSFEVPHTALIDRDSGKLVGAELGKHRELFSGTDALASSIVDVAAPWIARQPYHVVLAEGARLSNRRFLLAALDGGYDLTLVLLDHPEADAWQRARSKAIGRVQSPAWVKGRLTASRNLADLFAGYSIPDSNPQSHLITVLRGHPDELLPQLTPLLSTDG